MSLPVASPGGGNQSRRSFAPPPPCRFIAKTMTSPAMKRVSPCVTVNYWRPMTPVELEETTERVRRWAASHERSERATLARPPAGEISHHDRG
jgi:hypothetical protein